MKHLLAFGILLYLSSSICGQVDYTWKNCTTIEVCVPSYPYGLYPNTVSNEAQELYSEVTLTNTVSGNTVVKRFIGVNNSCVQFSNLKDEWRYRIELKVPRQSPTSCVQVRRNSSQGEVIGCLGVVDVTLEDIETNPPASQIGLYPFGQLSRITYDRNDIPYYCENEVENGVVAEIAGFGGTAYRIDIKRYNIGSTVSRGYATTGWIDGYVPNSNVNLLDIWSSQHSSWEFWGGNEYKVTLAQRTDNCVGWVSEVRRFIVENRNCRTSQTQLDGVRAFPNPITNTIAFKNLATALFDREYLNYSVHTPDGRQFREGVLMHPNQIIDASDWSSGVYIIRLNSGGNSVHVQKVVK